MPGKYEWSNQGLMVYGKDEQFQATNFNARIVKEKVYHEVAGTQRVFTIEGRKGCFDDQQKLLSDDDAALETVDVTMDEFASERWVSRCWGSRAIVFPVGNASAELRTAILSISEPKIEHIYTSIGWQKLEDGTEAYLTPGGTITPTGYRKDIIVQLPSELMPYSLTDPKQTTKAHIKSSIDICTCGPDYITFPLWIATYRAAIGEAAFCLHLSGTTGSFKTEFSSILQSHFGHFPTTKTPASWSATPNALEALAFRAKDAVMMVDDFVPIGTSNQIRQQNANVDKLVRAAGNQQGRARLSDTINVQQTMYPRCLVLSTGEDIPEGHSLRGRCLIAETFPGWIDANTLTSLQDKREDYVRAMSSWIQWLATNYDDAQFTEMAKEFRKENAGVGHSRTPTIIGELAATLQLMLAWLSEVAQITPKYHDWLWTAGYSALKKAAQKQASYVTDSDPVEVFCDTIKRLLETRVAHVRTTRGAVPLSATHWGWTSHESSGETTTYEAAGPTIGWLDRDKRELLFDPNHFALIKKACDGKIGLTERTMGQRLTERAIIRRTDAARQRTTIRQKVGDAQRNLWALDAAIFMPEDDGQS